MKLFGNTHARYEALARAAPSPYTLDAAAFTTLRERTT